jgi:hypothetical protein
VGGDLAAMAPVGKDLIGFGMIVDRLAMSRGEFASIGPETPAYCGLWEEWLYSSIRLIPINFGESIHFTVELAPHVKHMYGDVLVLVSAEVPGGPCDFAGLDLLVYLMNKVIVGLFRLVVRMLKNSGDT